MAKKWTNKNLPGALHFVTGNVDRRRPIFRREDACLAFLTELQNLKSNIPCLIIAFVIMLDHFHLIVNPRNGDIRQWCGALKSLTAKSLTQIFPEQLFVQPTGERQVWQESFKALPLWSDWMIWQKINYIHANPLKAGLVEATADYRWSSFHSLYGEVEDPLLLVDKEWWWPDDVQKLAKAMAEWNEELEDEYKNKRGQSRPS
jgi:REP element-mobilizing transposase RayT